MSHLLCMKVYYMRVAPTNFEKNEFAVVPTNFPGGNHFPENEFAIVPSNLRNTVTFSENMNVAVAPTNFWKNIMFFEN